MNLGGWLPLLVAIAGVVLTSGVGIWATALGPWYDNLKKPSFQPPDWLFGPAWTTIFALIAASAYLAWRDAPGGGGTLVVAAFVTNGVLNALWSWLFFRRRRPDWAFVEVVAFWLSIVLLVAVAARSSALAAWLLAPYLVWVTFAAVLNRAIVRLNAPFG